LRAYFQRHGRFTAGMGTHYGPSLICGDAPRATGAKLRDRHALPFAPVVRLADDMPLQLGHVAKADGRWRL
jgi:phenol 2-monooxygenase/3-hydroxybenzoate 4-monooxygenase